MSASVAVLFAREDSIYKSLPGCDVFDMQRDARNYRGCSPVVAHPPCRAWGRLRHFARPRPDEKELAFFAVDCVRQFGGVLEHPAFSSLWAAAGLPLPGEGSDDWGGWTWSGDQFWFGHRAEKRTWLYVVGCRPADLPSFPLVLGDAPCVVETRKRAGCRPAISKREREATPLAFANWLRDVSRNCFTDLRHSG